MSATMSGFFTTLDRKLDRPAKEHLKKVYASMSMALMAAAIGSYIHLYLGLMSGGLLTSLAALGFGIALVSTPDTGKNTNQRLSYMLAFALFSGVSMGPLLDLVLFVNPTIISTAFLATCVIFACFSLSAIFADSRQMLYVGGLLTSALSTLLLLSLANIFIGSYFLYQTHVYLGLFVACGFIMYDTSLILAKREMGDTDYIWHSVLLFVDFLDVFRHLLVILMQKDAEKNRKRK